jgi:DNA-binding GntR family transcriptional regulator
MLEPRGPAAGGAMTAVSTSAVARGRGGLAEEVCRKIADDIAMGIFLPGERLDETNLATRFQVSRTPVREALKQLAITGLVAYRPNRGSVVAEMTPLQLDQMFEVIGELEATCARHAALRMTEAERQRLCDLHAQTRVAIQNQDADAYDTINRDLHTVIIQGCHNPVLIDIVTGLRHKISTFRRTQFRNLARMSASYEEHSVIVEALMARDVVTCYREMRGHLLSARSAAAHVSTSWSTS